ncbi:nijmegen breakage syndrome 1 protein isoform X1 [Dendrobium catenatum]|uniref:nijmegen breakage syndrome 1 protein isoform X1 n=2 Tax=Dendrobium catenatum TaxID=906689 RepID=UPI0009F255AD|nr:nijmegen breakage syndrome 1 protein isoform X1 [Dendrobium catenatum]
MVWGLVPADALRGAQKYYILAPGTYKVGRKDCDIIVQMDPSVSRLHAEIVVDQMISSMILNAGSTKSNSHVRIRDSSKFGTFVKKELGPKARLRQGEEATLIEGDIVTFGTGNASFRFCCVPFRIFIHRPMRGQLRSIQSIASSIGATVTSNWSTECTHTLVNESSLVTTELIEAILAKQLVILVHWFEVLAEKNICTEFPSCTAYLPNLNLEDNMVRIVDPKIRENCLDGYLFVLGSCHEQYKFGDKLQLLLEMIGAKFVGADEYLLDSQTSTVKENNQVVLVVSGESTSEFNNSRKFSSLSRISDVKLMVAILSGNLDSSLIEVPSIVISSSHSTDETIVADSDVETDTALSTQAGTNIKSETAKDNDTEDDDTSGKREDEEHVKNSDVEETANCMPMPIEEDVILIRKFDKSDASDIGRHENSDILYSQDLIVRNTIASVQPISSKASSVNFKCFRKRETVSGNSFRDLIPFSKDPYKESEHGRDESDYMRDERKRKKLEAIAEEMFNSEKLKKRAAASTSLEAFLARC